MSPLAELYYRNWSTDQSADGLERFLVRHSELNGVQLVEVLLVDQALEWRRGLRPGVEQYLERFPAVADQRQGVLELVYGEMKAVQTLGLRITIESYISRFPDLAEAILRQAEVSEWVATDGENTKPADWQSL